MALLRRGRAVKPARMDLLGARIVRLGTFDAGWRSISDWLGGLDLPVSNRQVRRLVTPA